MFQRRKPCRAEGADLFMRDHGFAALRIGRKRVEVLIAAPAARFGI
jgi:hypothetical protein